jgi:hypothetical protein
VDVTYLSKQAFDSTLFTMLTHGKCEALDTLNASRVFNRCYECAEIALKSWQRACRNELLIANDTTAFGWQYAFQMLGRLDHPYFIDRDDFEDRLDYSDLLTKNHFSGLVDEFNAEFEAEIAKEGARYGSLIDVTTARKATAMLPEHSFLTEVAPGSIPAQYVKEEALDEIGKVRMNKKLNFAYAKKKDIKRLGRKSELHSRSTFAIKHELAKMRNLAPGSIAHYYYSCILSTPAENRYLATLPEVPLHLAANNFTLRMGKLRHHASYGYVACRDYANYNVAHKHEHIRLFYSSIKTGLKHGTHEIIPDAVDKILTCLTDVGITDDEGHYYRWNYGLMSGWRHTMLINTTFNAILARVSHRMLLKYENIKCLDVQAVGDDSAEVYDNPIGGPWVQGLMDAIGRKGKPEKQLFSTRHNAPFEFLRVLYANDGTYGSSVRASCSFVCPDTQSPVPISGPQMASSVMESINRIEARANTSLLRKKDILCLTQYWINSPDNIADGPLVPAYAAFCPTTQGGLGCVHHSIPPSPITGQGYMTSSTRHGKIDCPQLTEIIKGKMIRIAPAIDLRLYAPQYTDDTISSAVEQYPTLHWSEYKIVEKTNGITKSNTKRLKRNKFGLLKPCPDNHQQNDNDDDTIRMIARATASAIINGVRVPIDFNETLREIAVSNLFAGSHTVARDFIKDYRLNEVKFRGYVSPMTMKGLVQLYRKDTALPMTWLSGNIPSFYTTYVGSEALRYNLTQRQHYLLLVYTRDALLKEGYRSF